MYFVQTLVNIGNSKHYKQYMHVIISMHADSKVVLAGFLGMEFSRTSNFILLSYMYAAMLEPSTGQYLSGLGKKVNRPTHAVVFTIHNTVGTCTQPYYCSSEGYMVESPQCFL